MTTPAPRLLINDLARHNDPLLPRLQARLRAVLESGWYILGRETAAFEAAFAAYCGTEHCIGVGNGTDALEIALRALGVGAGDEVVTAANAGGYSTSAIRCAGATPRYADIEAESMLMAPDSLAETLTARTKAIVATHLYGRMADMPSILAIAGAAGVPVVEDCAQAHGARSGGRHAGAWGAAGCFSFYPTKNLGALGDGGAIVTNDNQLAARIRALRQYGWVRKYESGGATGRNSRLDELQAAVLSEKLPLLDGWNARRRAIAALYSELLAGSAVAARRIGGEDDVVHLYVVRSPHRDRIRAALGQRAIGSEIHYPIPDHRQAGGQTGASLPVTERCCREILTLPCFPEMRDEEVAEVAEIVRAAS